MERFPSHGQVAIRLGSMMSGSPLSFLLLEGGELRNAAVIRGLIIWAALRLLWFFASSLFTGSEATLSMSVMGKVALLAIVAVVIRMESLRRGEGQFLANLGVPAGAMVGPGLLVPLLMEIVLP